MSSKMALDVIGLGGLRAALLLGVTASSEKQGHWGVEAERVLFPLWIFP